MTLTRARFRGIVRLHVLWLAGDAVGKRLKLMGIDLRKTNFHGTNLSKAILREANLCEDLREYRTTIAHCRDTWEIEEDTNV